MQDASWANDEKLMMAKSFHTGVSMDELSALEIHRYGPRTTALYIFSDGVLDSSRRCVEAPWAETQDCVYAMETGVAIRTLIAELQGKRMRHDSEWEENGAKTKRHL